MKAVRYYEKGLAEVMNVEDVPTPDPQEFEALIRIEAAGVNYGDILRRNGHYYPIPTPLPHIPGVEVVGIVEKVGAGVPSEFIGKRVASLGDSGGYAEFVVRPASSLIRMPEGLDPVTGVALFIQGLTASLLLREGSLAPGETVLVPAAAGGVGSLALQLAIIGGAKCVYGGASTPDKREIVAKLGGCPIDYTQVGWEKNLIEMSGGGVDLALEMSGGSVFEASFEALKTKGRMIIYGNASDVRVSIKPEPLLKRSLTVKGFFLPNYILEPGLAEGILQNLAALVSTGKLKPEIGGIYALTEAPQAHRTIENRTSTGKLVFVPSGFNDPAK